MAQNPFSLGGKDLPLCDRQKEMQTFIRHAQNGQNVLVYGSRRLGKTMLIREVQRHLAQDGFLVVYENEVWEVVDPVLETWLRDRVCVS